MSELGRLTTALEQRYRIERRLGAGGTARSDIYAIGAVTYEMLIGWRPAGLHGV